MMNIFVAPPLRTQPPAFGLTGTSWRLWKWRRIFAQRLTSCGAFALPCLSFVHDTTAYTVYAGPITVVLGGC